MKRESVCRHLLIAVEAIIVSMLFLSCRKEKAGRDTLTEIMSSQIIIPQNIEQIFEGESSCLDSVTRRAPKLLVFVDSLQCGECQVSKFLRFYEIMEYADSSNAFKVMFLLSPKKAEKEKMREHIRLVYMPYPICVDTDNAFRRMNPCIPDDYRFHCLYIGSDGVPLFVGDPTANKKLGELFKRRVLDGDVFGETE